MLLFNLYDFLYFQGMVLRMKCINGALDDSELFDDDPYWTMWDASSNEENVIDAKLPLTEDSTPSPICASCKRAQVCKCLNDIKEECTLDENGPYLTINM